MDKSKGLPQIENEILNIATEIVNKNRVLKLKKLYKIAKSKLDFPDEAINKAI